MCSSYFHARTKISAGVHRREVMGTMLVCKSLGAQQSHHSRHSHHLDELGGGNVALGGLLGGERLRPAGGGTMPLQAVFWQPTCVGMKDVDGTNVKQRICLSYVE